MTDHSYAKGRYAVFIIMLNVVIQSVDMLNVIMLSVEVPQIWRYDTTFSIMALSIMTFSIMTKPCYVECHFCCLLLMPSVTY